jgi:hypothetical protein
MKIATAQLILRRLSKQAGIMLPVAAGVGLVAAANGIKKTLQKSHEHHAGFNPNYVPGGHG